MNLSIVEFGANVFLQITTYMQTLTIQRRGLMVIVNFTPGGPSKPLRELL